jgi:hypothetical protein
MPYIVIFERSTSSRVLSGMDTQLEDARKDLDKQFAQLRKNIDALREGLDKISAAGPEDDISSLLDDFQDMVKKVRTGGLLGSGAKGHREAREHYFELRGMKA